MKKIWAIADIHGCCESLISLIENQINPSKKDELVFLGDYIDRGPNVKGVIDYILKLKCKGYQIHTLRGNHEDVLLRCYEAEKNDQQSQEANHLKEKWYYHGGGATLDSFEAVDVKEIPDLYLDFFQNLPYYYLTDKCLFVHAGLNFSVEDPFSDTNSMMWIKSFTAEPEKIGNRKIIHGHVPTELEDIRDRLNQNQSVIPLDNGCVYHRKNGMGNLLALELNSLELAVQQNIEYVYEMNAEQSLKAVA